MSKTATHEAALKKKLQVFLADLAKVGTTQGFKYFQCYIRGKEELIISIKNSLPPTVSHGSILSQPVSRKQSLRKSDSLNSSCLPYDRSNLTLSHNSQMGLSGLNDTGIGLPPASPSELEPPQGADMTNFLIAGYSRYSCPYVWIRSNHQRLMKLATDEDIEKDAPLRLKTTSRWLETDVCVYEIIAELVKLCTYPAPRNPFELDYSYFHQLAQPFQVLATAGMISFLDKIVTHAPDSCPYSRKVFQEHQHLSKLHFSSLYDLVESSNIPILKQLKEKSEKRAGPCLSSGSRSISSSLRHAPPSCGAGVPSAIRSTVPVNNASSIRYGQGPSGAFIGGFDRMPAPSMF